MMLMMKLIFLFSALFLTEVLAVSKPSTRKFTFTVYNDLIDPVDVKWVDFKGQTRTAENLASKKSNKFDSFFGHEWVLQSGSISRYFILGEGLLTSDGVSVRVSQLNAIKPRNPNPTDSTQKPYINNSRQKPIELNTQPDVTPYSDSCNSQFQAEMLSLHNNARSRHRSPQMRLNEELNRNAIETAKNSARFGTLTKSSNRNNMGENLGALLGGGNSNNCAGMATQIFDMWYKGEKSYDYNAAQFSSSAGLFTQVVWASSTELGCGVACQNSYCYAVCNYRNPGNVVGGFAANVFAPYY